MEEKRFRVAPMSPDIRALTSILIHLPALVLLLPVGELTRAGRGAAAAALVLLYAVIWLFWRPSSFTVSDEALVIDWPLRRKTISRSSIASARVTDFQLLAPETGPVARIGAGGLWGGFGLLWTRKRGLVNLYITRTGDLVWLERGRERPWLISPENPGEFVASLSGH